MAENEVRENRPDYVRPLRLQEKRDFYPECFEEQFKDFKHS